MFGNIPNNFFKTTTRLPFKSKYLYIDTIDSLDEDQFRKRKIPIKFSESIKIHGGPYIIRICTISKRCEPGFKEIMQIIERGAINHHYPDYPTICNHIMKIIKSREEEDSGRKFWERAWYTRLKEIG